MMVFAGAGSAVAQGMAEASDYRPKSQVSGTLRIWGHGNRKQQYMQPLLRAWEEAFRRYQPNVRFENGMTGNASAIGGLFTGAADISFMDREIWATELDAFQQGAGHDPFSVAVASGSVAGSNHAPAIAVFVRRDNPIKGITLVQLDAIYGAEHRRSRGDVRTWGELGLTGPWASRRIHPYGYGIDRRESQYFQHVVMMGSQQWTCDLREAGNRTPSDPSGMHASQEIQNELAKDPGGIAIATLEFVSPQLKTLPVAADDSHSYVSLSEAAVASRIYPLVQTLYAYSDRQPGKPLAPAVKEFMAFILSREGQSILEQEHSYLPLPRSLADQQLRRLE